MKVTNELRHANLLGRYIGRTVTIEYLIPTAVLGKDFLVPSVATGTLDRCEFDIEGNLTRIEQTQIWDYPRHVRRIPVNGHKALISRVRIFNGPEIFVNPDQELRTDGKIGKEHIYQEFNCVGTELV